eukprot:6853380-Prymnesium_polylepis.1
MQIGQHKLCGVALHTHRIRESRMGAAESPAAGQNRPPSISASHKPSTHACDRGSPTLDPH